jgi:hypothetical protein
MTVFAALTALAVSAMLASGCGGNEEATPADAPATAKSGAPTATISEDEAYRSPRSITCTDIQTQSSAAGKATRAAANALTATVKLRDASQYQTAQRLLFAMNDLCKRAGDGSYTPAADAVKAVKSGRYRLTG